MPADLLVVFVSFSRDEHDIAAARGGYRALNGAAPLPAPDEIAPPAHSAYA